MKSTRLYTIVPLLFFLLTSVHAQMNHDARDIPCLGRGDSTRLADAECNYVSGLCAENHGLVESSLSFAVQLRLRYPDRSFTALERAVDRLVLDGATPGIRYKAMLASTVFAAPRLIDTHVTDGIGDGDELFAAISAQLGRKLLVHNE
ncbi:MAG: hypothetical protein RBU27_02580 [Bacteroidota bacterium]|jgi:hypothetical protein|nr:hypothetical protein [Bacteroidota bacterium]